MKYHVTVDPKGRAERVNIDDGSSKVEVWHEDTRAGYLVLKTSGRMARGLHIGDMEYRPATFWVARILEKQGPAVWFVEDVTDFPAARKEQGQ